MPDGVPPAVAKSFLALIPGFCVLAVVLALRLAVEASPFGDINSMIATLIGIPMHHVGGTLPGMIISVILIGILWTLACTATRSYWCLSSRYGCRICQRT